jgi:hypothetical protein
MECSGLSALRRSLPCDKAGWLVSSSPGDISRRVAVAHGNRDRCGYREGPPGAACLSSTKPVPNDRIVTGDAARSVASRRT